MATEVVATSQKWEYKVEYIASTLKEDTVKIAGHLNEFGEEGWELVAAWPEMHRYFFKRPKSPPA
jgi:hypothetical protein